MAIVAKSTGQARELVPAGKYYGVVVGVYDIGTQPSEQYDPTHKVILQFELHKKKSGLCRDKEGRPLVFSGFYPLAFGKRKNGEKSKLRQAVESILGRAFTDDEAKVGYDIGKLLEKVCGLVIVHDTNGGTTYDTIQSIVALDEEDTPKLASESNVVLYELDPAEEISTDVPEWIVKMIKKSAEWVKAHGKDDGSKRPAKPAKAKATAGAGKGKPAGDDDEDDDDDDDIPF